MQLAVLMLERPGTLVITVEDVRMHHRELLGKVDIEALVTGNLRQEVGCFLYDYNAMSHEAFLASQEPHWRG